MATFLQIANRMADRLDDSQFTTIYNADTSTLNAVQRRYREHINLAYTMVKLHLGRTDEYKESTTTISLVSGTESYSIPSTLLNIDHVQIGTDPPLTIIAADEYETYKRQFLTVTDTGYPTVCTIYERKVWFYPTPDEAFTANVRGQELITDLDLDTDEPDLPSDVHRAIQEIAIAIEMQYQGDPAAGSLAVAENGGLMGQGGQAAIAVNLLNLSRRNINKHKRDNPRMRNRYESRNKEGLRRVIY